MRQNGIQVTVLRTEYAGHAAVYARTVDLDGYDGLLVIGGDGGRLLFCVRVQCADRVRRI